MDPYLVAEIFTVGPQLRTEFTHHSEPFTQGDTPFETLARWGDEHGQIMANNRCMASGERPWPAFGRQ